MGSIVTVAQSKGGAGKTTLVSALGPNLAAAGYRVAVVDSDRNQSFAGWHAQAYEGPVLTVATEVDHVRIVDVAGGLAEEHDVVLVDTAGFENLYRPRLMGHRVAAYAARAAVEIWSCRTALGGLNPCRSISQVAL